MAKFSELNSSSSAAVGTGYVGESMTTTDDSRSLGYLNNRNRDDSSMFNADRYNSNEEHNSRGSVSAQYDYSFLSGKVNVSFSNRPGSSHHSAALNMSSSSSSSKSVERTPSSYEFRSKFDEYKTGGSSKENMNDLSFTSIADKNMQFTSHNTIGGGTTAAASVERRMSSSSGSSFYRSGQEQ